MKTVDLPYRSSHLANNLDPKFTYGGLLPLYPIYPKEESLCMVIIFNSVMVYAIVLFFRRGCGDIVAVASILILSGVHIHRILVMMLLHLYSVFLHID